MSDSPFGYKHKRGDCYATWYVRRKASELAGKYGFVADEVDDLVQELTLQLIRQWPVYDATRSKVTTFIQNVVDGKVCELLRGKRRAKRNYRREISLSAVATAAEHGVLDGIRRQPEISQQGLMDLRSDCQSTLATLPEELRTIAELLKDHCPEAVARELGIARSTLWRRIAELRERFIAAGYGDA